MARGFPVGLMFPISLLAAGCPQSDENTELGSPPNQALVPGTLIPVGTYVGLMQGSSTCDDGAGFHETSSIQSGTSLQFTADGDVIIDGSVHRIGAVLLGGPRTSTVQSVAFASTSVVLVYRDTQVDGEGGHTLTLALVGDSAISVSYNQDFLFDTGLYCTGTGSGLLAR